jgi:ATP-dependent helicase Lhr and Lhr-like helicase
MSLDLFHPVIQQWFRSRFAAPTEPQLLGWPHLAESKDVLIAAPTGSGKTLTAFLAAIDRLLKLAERRELEDEFRVVYVSPLRALSNDMHRNLEVPLAEILAVATEMGLEIAPIRAGLRTGDTTASQRAALVKRPPHILVTTPESLYLMLTSPKAREKLRTVETVIVDEIHALVRDKRGSHLALTLERLAALCPQRLQRIGLSATQRPIEEIARFLVGEVDGRGMMVEGHAERDHMASTLYPQPSTLPTIIDIGHRRDLDLAIEVPPSDLGTVCMHEQWAEINERIVELVNSHRATLIFVNTRRLAERLTHQLSELLGEDAISSHHGSLAFNLRQDTERRLKTGHLKAVVATASLEMGLDIGYIDLVIQIGSPRNIATFLQRVGRSGHALGLIPKGRLFALTRDELIECMALMRAIKHGRLDIVPIPVAPLDVLAQQIVAEVATRECGSDELFELCRRAAPYRDLPRADFDRVVQLLSEGITQSAGRSRVYLHHDQVGRRLRARPGARIAATSNAGAIPEVFSIRVVTEEDHTVVGSVDEDFGTESQAGDIFLLGNTSWRIRYLRGGDLFVTDAAGAPPTIPFWRGEAPGRTFELSDEVSRLREDLEQRLSQLGQPELEQTKQDVVSAERHDYSSPVTDCSPVAPSTGNAGRSDTLSVEDWLVLETNVNHEAAQQIVFYVRAQKAAIGLLPTQRRVVFERFFDESGGMQMVIHAPFGTRITRAWGLAMRKRFCRSFDFELQASADDDGIVLSIGPQHSFPLESMFGMLTPRNVQDMFEQAVLAVPIFLNRWRWNATRALQVLRARNGKKVPPALQRFRSEDLLTAVFPKLTGCQENVVGDIELPDHPLVRQTMDDCLHEAHDIDALKEVLGRVERGEIEFLARDTREPSPFSYELLNANPYAFLDGGEVAERRARAVATRRTLTVESVEDLGRLDPEAIRQVVAEAQPLIRNADELHDALLSRVLMPAEEGREWRTFFEELVDDGRATCVTVAERGSRTLGADSDDAGEEPPHPNPLPLPLKARGEGTKLNAWVATERVPAIRAAFPAATLNPSVTVPPEVKHGWESIDARVAMVRGLLEICGPITGSSVAGRIGITVSQADAALEALEGEGVVLRGKFTRSDFRGESSSGRNESTCVLDNSPTAAPSPASSSLKPDVSHLTLVDSSLPPVEWCHRRLLARIHRMTLDGLRKQIEPVTVDVFVRFLARHHGLAASHRRAGANGLFEAISQLQGLDIPAVAWERDILPARVDQYRPDWLDELCLTGDVGWGRLFAPARNPDKSRPMASLTKVAPISLFLREDAAWLTDRAPRPDFEGLSSPAVQVCELLQARGAMFAADLLAVTQMLPSQLDDVLGELVTRGWLTADGFGGLRALIADKSPRGRMALRHRGERRRSTRMSLGRWSLCTWGRFPNRPEESEAVRSTERPDYSSPDAPSAGPAYCSPDAPSAGPASTSRPPHSSPVEDWAWQLLRRWGVVFRDLLAREDGAPAWWELLQVLRRLEARGEIRGGRFIVGVAGEQFALPDSIQQLRRLRDETPSRELLVVSAADPLNLVGVLTNHERVPKTASNRIAYLDGHPVASFQAGEVVWLSTVPKELTSPIADRLTQIGAAGEVAESATAIFETAT